MKSKNKKIEILRRTAKNRRIKRTRRSKLEEQE